MPGMPLVSTSLTRNLFWPCRWRAHIDTQRRLARIFARASHRLQRGALARAWRCWAQDTQRGRLAALRDQLSRGHAARTTLCAQLVACSFALRTGEQQLAVTVEQRRAECEVALAEQEALRNFIE